jgi:signal transduction histidine kinase
MVTALSERQHRLQGIEAGANDFLAKPIDRQDVALRVRNAAHTKRLYDRVQAELARVKELEALRANLTSFIVHDMRSPLMAIMGGLQIVADRASVSPEDRQFLDMSLGSVGELTEMVSAMLDVSRMESRQMPLHCEVCEADALADSAIKRIAALANFHDVRIEVSGTAGAVNVDKGLIERVLINFLHNAIKFSPSGSRIEVRFSREDATARVEVSDRGPGIPPEQRERIFEKFGQVESRRENRKYSTGLGLTFCKMAVEAHGGRIGVESEVGKGSTFWFALPIPHLSEETARKERQK